MIALAAVTFGFIAFIIVVIFACGEFHTFYGDEGPEW